MEMKLAPSRLAPRKLAPWSFTPWSFASLRLAPSRLAPSRSAPWRLAPVRRAPGCITYPRPLTSMKPVLKPVTGSIFSKIQTPYPKEDIELIIKNNTLKIIGFFMPPI